MDFIFGMAYRVEKVRTKLIPYLSGNYKKWWLESCFPKISEIVQQNSSRQAMSCVSAMFMFVI